MSFRNITFHRGKYISPHYESKEQLAQIKRRNKTSIWEYANEVSHLGLAGPSFMSRIC